MALSTLLGYTPDDADRLLRRGCGHCASADQIALTANCRRSTSALKSSRTGHLPRFCLEQSCRRLFAPILGKANHLRADRRPRLALVTNCTSVARDVANRTLRYEDS
jgi:hypothetical protein